MVSLKYEEAYELNSVLASKFMHYNGIFVYYKEFHINGGVKYKIFYI